MTDKPLFNNSYEPGYEAVAGNHSSSRMQSATTLEDRQQASRKSTKQGPSFGPTEAGLDNSRAVSMTADPRRVSGTEYDTDADDGHEISLEQRLARDRIKHLHDVFVSSQSSEGLSMEEFRSAMRQVLLMESGREMEDDELDKVLVTWYRP